MQDQDILFDSRNELYKSPMGAVTSGTEVTFNIFVASECRPEKARLVMLYDRHTSPAYYEPGASEVLMDGDSPSDDGREYIKYSFSVTIGDTGLYWYHFHISTPDGDFAVGKSGGDNRPVIASEPASWQQTVYDRKYKVPEWITGGTFYHIFVDRFNKGPGASDSGTDSTDSNAPDDAFDKPGTSDAGAPEAVADTGGHDQSDSRGRIVRSDWGGTPNWEPVDGRVLNNDFFGGNIRGIIEKLPYLSDLGATCLYLSPIFEAYSNHKYDTSDYEKIDPMFGSEDDLRELCQKAGELGMQVILDGVFSHTGSDSKYFDRYGNYGGNGAYGNEDSPYHSWYYFHEDGTYDSWWDFDTLPKLNKEDPAYVEYINGENGIIRKWLRDGISGWRLDVADELPVSFLTKLVAAAKAEKDDSIIVGEVWEDASNKEAYSERKNYFEGDKLDSVMNYPFRIGIIDFIRNGNSCGLAETVEQIVENYPKDVTDCLMNLLSTHDSIRILTALAGEDLGPDPTREVQAATHLSEEDMARGKEMLKSASLLQITLPGVPCVYYGDEAGVEGYKDPFNRTCYPWGHEDEDLRSWYRTLLNIRKEHGVFRHGGYKTLAKHDGLFAFMRFSEGDLPVIICVNAGLNQRTLPLRSVWKDLLSGKETSGEFVLPPGSRFILESSRLFSGDPR